MKKLLLSLTILISNSLLAHPIIYTCPASQDIIIQEADEYWLLTGNLVRKENQEISQVKIFAKMVGNKPQPHLFNGIFLTQNDSQSYDIGCSYSGIHALTTHSRANLGKNCQVINSQSVECY